MCATSPAARRRKQDVKPPRSQDLRARSPIVAAKSGSGPAGGADFSYMDLGDSARVAVTITPQGRGPFREQAREVVSNLRAVLGKQPEPMALVTRLGAGRGFTLLLGHDTHGMDCPGFKALLQRGTEWAATGKIEE